MFLWRIDLNEMWKTNKKGWKKFLTLFVIRGFSFITFLMGISG
jgi:hypothetical protein